MNDEMWTEFDGIFRDACHDIEMCGRIIISDDGGSANEIDVVFDSESVSGHGDDDDTFLRCRHL